MKTTQITVERNFHIMNDDRFIMEKISVTKELDDEQDQEQVQIIIDDARATIENNFKAAYPHVETHLNFHVERQQSSAFWNSQKAYTGVSGSTTPIVEIPEIAPTERIDKEFNLVDEINKITKPVFLKVFEKQCKTPEEKKAYQAKLKQLSV